VSEAEVAETTYRIDAGRSRFTVRAFATGVLSAFGHSPTIAVRKFTGEVRLPAGSPEGAAVSMAVEADSLVVTDDVGEKDRAEIERTMRQEVLETGRFPEVSFESTSVSAEKIYEGQYRLRIAGRLSLHGVTREVPIEAQVTWTDERLRARGEFALKQSDYRIKPVSAVGGTIKLKDELKLAFDLTGNKL
jgi:polyisoprenoid-binding protein YceI